MLEPLFRCNLACTGCGKIQHPRKSSAIISPSRMFRSRWKNAGFRGFHPGRRAAFTSTNR
jgi:MoaA/NifB/PqqE/SkfB family radical SAM enzyme